MHSTTGTELHTTTSDAPLDASDASLERRVSPLESLEALLAEFPKSQGARLSWGEKCGAFVALHRGVPQNVVAKAFGVTPTTISLLASCLAPRADAKTKYANVRREFEALGAERFDAKYYTSDIADRLTRWRLGQPTQADKKIRPYGSAPAATMNAHEGFHEIPTHSTKTPTAIAHIHWVEGEGWTVSEVDQPSFLAGQPKYNWTEKTRFKSSTAALKAAYEDIYAFDYPDHPPAKLELPR